MSHEANVKLLEEAAEIIDADQDSLITRVLEQSLAENDLDTIFYVVKHFKVSKRNGAGMNEEGMQRLVDEEMYRLSNPQEDN